MIKFKANAGLTPAFNGHKFRLNKSWSFVYNGKIYVIPAGFWTDFASVGIFSPLDKTLYPALIHDWLYYSGIVSRYRADRIFLEAMKFTGVSYVKRYTYYYGVRVGGWKPYNKYRKKNKK